jgi:glycosyltransferase involved in cell wall biosynthesis
MDMASFGIARHLPHLVRPLLTRLDLLCSQMRSAPFSLAKLRPRRQYSGDHVAVVGLFSSRSGIGRGAHLIALGIERTTARVLRVDITELLDRPSHIANTPYCTLNDCIKENPTDVIIVVNPAHFFDVIKRLGAEWLSRRCVVAHWVFELNVLPRSWRNATCVCDEIWCPSEFVAETIRTEIFDFDGPIKVFPYPADLDPPNTPSLQSRLEARQRLRIDQHAFVAGYSFSASSSFVRKNPEAAIRAFRLAFPDDDDNVTLLIRCLDIYAFPTGKTRLNAAACKDRRVMIFDHEPPLCLNDFYAAIDVYLAPARSEGYGLNLAEVSQIGLPVIATRWSLSDDILLRQNVVTVGYRLVPVQDPQGSYIGAKRAKWAEPNLDELIACLRTARTGNLLNRARS